MSQRPHTVTRFAPSPTGFMHLGNVRSALYPWAFARATGGRFIVRIEDTDQDRNSEAAVETIMQALQWLGLDMDEGPLFQMQRMPRFREVLEQLKASGHLYPCYMGKEELEQLRARQEAQKIKPRYDGTWRPEEGKVLPVAPQGVQPVWRFKTPRSGSVVWEDKVKGRIEISNAELDDLVVARPDGTPTYNFCVVVDDIDMGITHVIRGEDHVNNTPRQIHIFNALGKPVPQYAHLPTVLGEGGEKMSKRDPRTKSVMQYAQEGFLPEAVLNYLARLGWSHGDDEIFSRQQFLRWFSLEHLGKSAAQFDEAKLRWVNAQYIKAMDNATLALLVREQLARLGVVVPDAADARCAGICALVKDRCSTTVELAEWAQRFYVAPLRTSAAYRAQHTQYVPEEIGPAIASFVSRVQDIPDAAWSKEAVGEAIRQTLAHTGLRMPQLAMPVRVLTLGLAQTPALDAVLALLGKAQTLARLEQGL